MIFLSASIPVQERHKKYIETADVIAIRDAIRALAIVVIPGSHLVWGGHPAITPLIHYVMTKMGADMKRHITLYQSKEFEGRYPEENAFFSDIVFTEKKETLKASLELMRHEMIHSHQYNAGIFIGGMEGVEDEFELFREVHPNAQVLPIASTGAAAKIVHDKYLENPDPRLLNDYAYMSLFKSFLKN